MIFAGRTLAPGAHLPRVQVPGSAGVETTPRNFFFTFYFWFRYGDERAPSPPQPAGLSFTLDFPENVLPHDTPPCNNTADRRSRRVSARFRHIPALSLSPRERDQG